MPAFNFGQQRPLTQFDPFNQEPERNAIGAFPTSPFKVPKLRINPLNPPETDSADPDDVDTAPVFKSSLESFRSSKTPDRGAYRDYLRTGMPTRQEHQLTKLGKALSLASGAAEGYSSGNVTRGVQHGLGLMERPYQQALEDFSTRGGMLKELAGLEYQDISDQKALEVQINEDALKRRKQWFDELKGRKDMQYTDKQIDNLTSEIENRGLSLERGSKTGELYVVDRVKKTRQSLGQFDNTLRESEGIKHEFWNKRYDKEQMGRFALQDDAQAHAAALQAQGHINAKDALKYKADLDKFSPESMDKAWNNAYDRVLAENPDLKDTLFTTDEKGNLVNKVGPGGKANEVHGQFIQAVNDRTRADLGLPPLERSLVDKNEDPQRRSAINRIRQYNDQNPDKPLGYSEGEINAMIEEQNKESRGYGEGKRDSAVFDKPYVNLPDYAGQVNPMLSNQGYELQNLGERPMQLPQGNNWWKNPRNPQLTGPAMQPGMIPSNAGGGASFAAPRPTIQPEQPPIIPPPDVSQAPAPIIPQTPIIQQPPSQPMPQPIPQPAIAQAPAIGQAPTGNTTNIFTPEGDEMTVATSEVARLLNSGWSLKNPKAPAIGGSTWWKGSPRTSRGGEAGY